MSVQQIGTRLVRNFGNGDKLRTVISEVVDGKTFTKVLDKNGNVVKNRVKAFSSTNVGDKFVKTRTTVNQDAQGKISKEVYDRVYMFDDLAGIRRTEYYIGDAGDWQKYCSEKQAKNGNRYRKYFDCERKTVSKWRVDEDFNSKYPLGARNVGYYDNPLRTYYNYKGLPISAEISHLASEDWKNASLKELRSLHIATAPDKPYSTGLNLDFLNKNIDPSHNLNNLDRFI